MTLWHLARVIRASRAVGVGDLAHAQLPAFARKAEAALRLVEEASVKGRIGVSYSGGKDSTVVLDLVRRVQPDAPAGFFDSGVEYPETYAIVEHYGAPSYHPRMTLDEMCRYGGYWGYDQAPDPDYEFDFFRELVLNPSDRFIREQDLAVIALGLRGQESAGRRMLSKARGSLYRVAYQQAWHLCPIQSWLTDDVWAYLASRELPYNAIYDRMAALEIPRANWRVSTLLGLAGADQAGRYAYLRQLAPAIWNRLVADFPKIVRYT